GKRSINALLDAAPEGISTKIRELASGTEGVLKVGQIRVRESGPKNFIDITVFIDKVSRLEVAHKVTDELSKKIEAALPGSDVVVHAEPICPETNTLVERIRAEASNYSEIKNIHNIRIFEANRKKVVDFHIELDGNLSLSAAHELATVLESKVYQLDPSISKVYSHFEPLDNKTDNGTIEDENVEITSELTHIIRSFPEIKSFNALEIKKLDGKYSVGVCCTFDKHFTINQSHEIATRLEDEIKEKCKKIESVTIHQEPDL
ncbi:MAG: hypothetical protein LUP94_02285, partial [Candidatus Methanomethylicus sp.]|nr:hypothetical protein [Candidatus Methanomethylicus sp.]